MRVLVTGGAGYIGSVTVERLVRAGADVAVFDNLSQGHREAVHPAAKFVAGDLADLDLLDETLCRIQPEAVLHFAARSLVGESMREPCRYFQANAGNAVNLLDCMLRRDVKRFVFSSTAALFGEPQRIPIDEDEKIAPGNAYGETKHAVERMLPWLERAHGLRYASLRYFNAAGASRERGEDHTPETHLIPLVLEAAQGRREQITIFGDDYDTRDGTCIRDYIHVVDLADAHILALRALERGSCVYNLGNGAGYSVKEVIETASKVTGRAIPFEIGPRREGDPAALVAGSDRIRRELGWRPYFARLEAIVESAWSWRQRFPNGYSTATAEMAPSA